MLNGESKNTTKAPKVHGTLDPEDPYNWLQRGHTRVALWRAKQNTSSKSLVEQKNTRELKQQTRLQNKLFFSEDRSIAPKTIL